MYLTVKETASHSQPVETLSLNGGREGIKLHVSYLDVFISEENGCNGGEHHRLGMLSVSIRDHFPLMLQTISCPTVIPIPYILSISSV